MKKVIVSVWTMIVISIMLTTVSNGYFYNYVQARGEIKVPIIQKHEIHTEIVTGTKKVMVKNTGEVPNFVRVKIVKPSTITIACTGEKWKQNADGYWYYEKGLEPQETTTELEITITQGNTGKVQSIVPVSETLLAFYTEDGNLQSKDWSNKYYITNSSNS